MDSPKAPTTLRPEFSPGPWHVGTKTEYEHNSISAAPHVPIMGPPDRRYSSTSPMSVGWADETNARLIAAAPDLYEALRAVLFCDDGHDGQTCAECFVRGSVALAKASGTVRPE